MHFINPIEILELNGRDAISIDNSEIKKAKKRLIADIELSEAGHLNYKGQTITKSDCERAINDLENNEKKEFYSYLTTNKALNDYLTSGDERIFRQFHQDSIFKLPEFINFISPYFTNRFERSLIQAFNSQDEELLGLILRTQVLISKSDINNGFRAVSKEIEHRIQELDKIKNEIKEGESSYDEDDIEEVIEIVEDYFPPVTLNLLPSYFQSQINKIGEAINYLGLAIWNEFTIARVPMLLEEHLLKLNIESVSRPIFEKNHKIYQEKYEEEVELELNAPTITKWAHILMECRKINDAVDSKKLQPKEALVRVNSLVNITDLNYLESFANEIREQITYSLRGLAVSSWNTVNDINSALKLIETAISIENPESVKVKLKKDKDELKKLELKYKDLMCCWFCGKNEPTKQAAFTFTMYKETNRTYFPRRVQYSSISLTITRCDECKSIHNKGSSNYWLGWFGGLIGGAFIGYLIDEHYIIGGIVGLIIGNFIGRNIESGESKKQGIKSLETSSLSQHSLVKEQLTNGWQFDEPSA
ncbi:MAG TPA: hypothetical protein PKK64_13045 [Saprospiraceae bacterium]|nr:hypothetical protein [Cyclobacteriaceae bacterium]HNN69409.1 hypothetical protein [Saprospiraceae bacterium]